MSFSFKPPILKTLPVNVISPVMAIEGNGTFKANEINAVVNVIPAEGPSLGVAPSGQLMAKFPPDGPPFSLRDNSPIASTYIDVPPILVQAKPITTPGGVVSYNLSLV
ncbi:hypothetical protein WICMUC_001439 [Wickerhamomyces mucosus]|uniref:Uncharacterized protein n=1 Tax=Wickerhamomyces mucosus TaxID=1378264 RepID=A0A9P8PU35_9ASCO|nr:hypothetical protein WICMUC_001439 [Wickerhamomyces mucosus]